MTTFETFMRTFNLLVSVAIVSFGVFSYFSSTPINQNSKDLSLTILPFYILLFGLIMIGIETGIGFLRSSMRFLTNFFGRGVFSIYVALMCLCLIRQNTGDAEKVVIYIIFSMMMLVGVLSIVGSLFCCKTHKK